MTFAVRVARGGYITSGPTRALFRNRIYKQPKLVNPNYNPKYNVKDEDFLKMKLDHMYDFPETTMKEKYRINPKKMTARDKRINFYRKVRFAHLRPGMKGVQKDFSKEAAKMNPDLDELARIRAQYKRMGKAFGP